MAEKLKVEIQKSIDKKQIKSSLLISETRNNTKCNNNIISISNSVSARNNKSNKKIINKKVHSCKYIINDNKNNSNNNYLKRSIPLKLNGNKKINIIKNKSPQYVNFIKIKKNKEKVYAIGGYEAMKKSNGKSVENKNNEINSNNNKSKFNSPNKYGFCNTIENFNKLNCFNMKKRKEKENGSTNKKSKNNVGRIRTKRYCEIIKENQNIKSNGKKLNVIKEKSYKELGNDNHRSYLNIYEKDRLNKKRAEKINNGKNNSKYKVKSPCENYRKNNEYTYRRALFKI